MKPYIYIIDILDKHKYRIPTPIGEGAIDPDWIVIPNCNQKLRITKYFLDKIT